jgi:arabinose-5-phosphate isomerase
VAAVNTLYNCKGKVVVTGVGKSGLIAQKIASTMSSTGTPAIYLHPSEAMHGNLGVVNRSDVVLAIGKSGESEEILTLLPSLRKIGSKIIALTGNRNSSLARAAAIVLFTPVKKEACPLDLAPTTSSTVALAIGDALAITLMKLRGFSSEKFALYHPGGLLGKKLLLRVSEVMRKGNRNPVVRVDADIKTLLDEISKKWTGAASIVDKKGKFTGLVTDYDIRQVLLNGKSLLNLSIREIMNPRPTTIHPDDLAIKAVDKMELRKKPFTVLPVVDGKKKAVGIIHIHDLIAQGLIQDQ